jgi:hypothetical protein
VGSYSVGANNRERLILGSVMPHYVTGLGCNSVGACRVWVAAMREARTASDGFCDPSDQALKVYSV